MSHKINGLGGRDLLSLRKFEFFTSPPVIERIEKSNKEKLIDRLNYIIPFLPLYHESTSIADDILKQMNEIAGSDFATFFSLLQIFLINPLKISENKLPKEQIDLFNKNMHYLTHKEKISSMKAWSIDLYNFLTLISAAATFLHYSLEPIATIPIISTPSSTQMVSSSAFYTNLINQRRNERQNNDKIKRKMPRQNNFRKCGKRNYPKSNTSKK